MPRTLATKETSQPEHNNAPRCLIDANEVARRLGCSDRTVYRMVDQGKLPPSIRVSSMRKWRSDQIDEWIELGGRWPTGRVATR